jgi:hypothetical protein
MVFQVRSEKLSYSIPDGSFLSDDLSEHLFQISMLMTQHKSDIMSKLKGSTFKMGEFRGTIVSMSDATATLKDDSTGALKNIPLKRLSNYTSGDTTRK